MSKFIKIILAVIATLILAVAMLYAFQEKLIFLQSTLPQDHVYTFEQEFEEINLKHPDGAVLNAIHFKLSEPNGIIIYFHGNAGTLERWGEITSYFTQFNYEVLVMDYRGYGKSTGKLSESALNEDAQLFYQYALDHFQEDEIIVYGRSLGTGIATYIASQNNPAKLILETPYLNLTDVANKRFPLIPMDKLLKYKFPSNEYIKNVDCPVTIFHGTSDNVVAYESGRALSDLVPDEQLDFITVQDGAHKNLIKFAAYKDGIKNTLNKRAHVKE